MTPIARITSAVCASFGLPAGSLSTPTRRANIALPRQIVFYLTRELTVETLKNIGAAFGMDHANVIYAHREIRDRLSVDHQLAKRVSELRNQLLPTL